MGWLLSWQLQQIACFIILNFRIVYLLFQSFVEFPNRESGKSTVLEFFLFMNFTFADSTSLLILSDNYQFLEQACDEFWGVSSSSSSYISGTSYPIHWVKKIYKGKYRIFLIYKFFILVIRANKVVPNVWQRFLSKVFLIKTKIKLVISGLIRGAKATVFTKAKYLD